MDLKAVEVKTHGDDYIVQGWNKGTSMAMDFEKHYSLEDLRTLDAEAREKRGPIRRTAEPAEFIAGSTLRATTSIGWAAGLCGFPGRINQTRFSRLPCSGSRSNRDEARRTSRRSTTIEELCIHIYKQRKKINLASERQAHRPFVSVAPRNVKVNALSGQA